MILKDLAVSDKTAPKEILKLFKRAGGEIAQSSVEKIRRQNAVSFKTIHLTMSDSQLIALRVKETGENQDDEKNAVTEIVNAWQSNVSKFQAALSRKKAQLPKGIQSTRKKIIETLQTQIAELDELIKEQELKLGI